MATEAHTPIHVRVFDLDINGSHPGQYVNPNTFETLDEWIASEIEAGYYFRVDLMADCMADCPGSQLRVVTTKASPPLDLKAAHTTGVAEG